MITFEIFLLGLLVVSTFTGLVTEAFKKVLNEQKTEYSTNVLAGLVALFLSAAIGIGYVVLSNIAFTAQVTVYLLALIFLSWLCAMVGYDKVIQALSQFKTSSKD